MSARMVLNGMWCGINGHATVVRMCPPLTTKNWVYYVPQLAVGTTSGVLYVVSLRAEAVVQEMAVHTCRVRSALSLSLPSFIHLSHWSFAHTRTHAHTHTHTHTQRDRMVESPLVRIVGPHISDGPQSDPERDLCD